MKRTNTDISGHVSGKVVLVTGGTGSFGNAVTERLLKEDPKEVVIFSRDEKKQFDMANKYRGDSRVRFVIGDVRDRDRVTNVMKGVDLVFHAAALKQVPQCEFFPYEALMTNAMGAYNVITAAAHHNIERVVVLSTDKAVYPINVMGITKALMERIMIGVSREKKSDTVLCGTRYGNVMYTRGSVIPFFVGLIKQGKPLTVTNGKMTRFLMSLTDSVDLVLYALQNGKDGEIYVRKAPAAAMQDLAQALAEIFNYKKGIVEIGLRPGEKMHESLISSEELFRVEDRGDYYRITPEVPGMDMTQYYFNGAKHAALPEEGFTSANTKQLSVAEVKKALLALPEIKEELKALKKK